MDSSLRNILKVLKVLYIDDKAHIDKTVQNSLTIFFKSVHYANNLENAIDLYNKIKPDIIISEISLNNKECLPLLQKIRKYNYQIPIIITSKYKNEDVLFNVIRLQALDFLVKPLAIDKFIYTLNNTAKHILHHGKVTVAFGKNYRYNYIDKTLQSKEKIIKLTKNESRLIELLLSNEGRVISKNDIEFHIWGEEYVSDSAFKSLFKRLRDKIGKDTLQNSSGHGYFFQ